MYSKLDLLFKRKSGVHSPQPPEKLFLLSWVTLLDVKQVNIVLDLDK